MSDLPLSAGGARSAPPPLADDEIHLWQLRADAGLGPRGVSALAHLHLGRLLSAYSGGGRPLAIARGPHGKPYAPEAGGIEFNVSHSGHYVLIAFARGQPLGVDLESVAGRRRAILTIAERFFAPDEAAALARLDGDRQHLAFLRLWTCKEAVLKAMGSGLHFGLDRLRFSLDADGQPRAVAQIVGDAGDPAHWHLHRQEAAAETVAALAWNGPERRVRSLTIGTAAESPGGEAGPPATDRPLPTSTSA
ncbi:4'-phosphopantetheinyl transferase family protein [Dokdonella koreensis]|uniref:Phosphopantetheinyl transferase n=1 Tax=Dokdonella koreensis DS-123 TaxID=1300342 RepID=A0A167HBZ3_9GAMM|nr:4'-phosphopantetheinyl transferase superfamily protein [Dokdonella koreensis]ANB19791.1 Phosphopantetheinyl transferase [Dokdonella koreensis DS-123]